jgi:hypothetical protein
MGQDLSYNNCLQGSTLPSTSNDALRLNVVEASFSVKKLSGLLFNAEL